MVKRKKTTKSTSTERENGHDEEEMTAVPTNQPILEYDETLYSRTTTPHQKEKTSEVNKKPVHRTSWENLDLIEQKIDTMRRTPQQNVPRRVKSQDDVEKKIDHILQKKKQVV